MAIDVRELTGADRPWLRALLEQKWGLPIVTPTGAYAAPDVDVVRRAKSSTGGYRDALELEWRLDRR